MARRGSRRRGGHEDAEQNGREGRDGTVGEGIICSILHPHMSTNLIFR